MKLAKHVPVTLPANPLSTLSSVFPQRLTYKSTCDYTKQTSQRPREERMFRGSKRGDERGRLNEIQRKRTGKRGRDTNSADPTASSGRFKSPVKWRVMNMLTCAEYARKALHFGIEFKHLLRFVRARDTRAYIVQTLRLFHQISSLQYFHFSRGLTS